MTFKDMQSLVSVIIPCYNGEKFITKAIESVLNQSYEYREVIVIDDGSTDNSLSIIQAYGPQVKWETTSNQGVQATRNYGLELAQGEFVKFLDADDILYPNCLKQQVEQALSLSSTTKGIVFGDAMWVDKETKPLFSSRYRSRYAKEDPVSYILENSSLTSCPLHRRQYLLEVGGFDEELHDCHENDLHLRLVLSGVEFFYLPTQVYKYRQHVTADRITVKARRQSDPLAYLRLLKKHEKLIMNNSSSLSDSVKGALARRFWRYGRAVLREHFFEESKRYFESARELDPKHCIVGNQPYPVLVGFFGPQKSEEILSRVKLFKRR